MLSAASLAVLFWYWPEVRFPQTPINDGILHQLLIREMDSVYERGGNILDFWSESINFGHAFVRSYQFLMHLVFWACHRWLMSGLRLEQSFSILVTLTAMLIPWSVYLGARQLGLSTTEASASSIAAVLVHETAGYGIGLSNFTFAGYGTYTQLFALLFFPLALGWTHTAWHGRSSVVPASLLFSAVLMSHILTGFMAVLWIAVDGAFAVASGSVRAHKLLKRAVLFALLSLLWTGHWIIPMAQDHLLQRRSTAEPLWKWTGHGAFASLSSFGSGAMLDAGRLPVLTVLAGIGLVLCLASWFRSSAGDRDFFRRMLGVQVLVWVLISFGPQTWGRIVYAFPFAGQLHWHRFFAGAQVAMILCAGVGFESIRKMAQALPRWPAPQNGAATLLLCALLLIPCAFERSRYFHSTNAMWLAQASYFAGGGRILQSLASFANSHQDGRFYFGFPGNWGKQLNAAPTVPMYAWLPSRGIETVGATIHHQSHAETLAYEADPFNSVHRDLMNVRYVGMNPELKAPEDFQPVIRNASFVLYKSSGSPGYFQVGSGFGAGCADNDALATGAGQFLQGPLPARQVFPQVLLRRNAAASLCCGTFFQRPNRTRRRPCDPAGFSRIPGNRAPAVRSIGL